MLTALLVFCVSAAPPPEGPKAFVRRALDELQVASAKSSVRTLAEKALTLFDFAALTEQAYGDGWSALSIEQQAALSTKVGQVLAYSYAKNASGNPVPGLELGAETIDGDRATVTTTVIVVGDRHPVSYGLLRRGTVWRVVDVTTDGTSLLGVYREQFAKLIAAGGYDRVLEAIEARWKPLQPLAVLTPSHHAQPAKTRPVSEAELLKAGGILFGVTRGVLDSQSPLGGD